MMDLFMLLILGGSFGLLYLLVRWCKGQVERGE